MDRLPANGVCHGIRKRIVCISGFTQGRYGRTGMRRLVDSLHREYASPSCMITSHEWNEDWSAIAAAMVDAGPVSAWNLDVRIVAYSWGVGYGALTLARELKSRGAIVRDLVSCDGVYFSKWGRWRAIYAPFSSIILGPPRVEIPAGVWRVHWLRQDTNHPKGHQIIALAPHETKVSPVRIVSGRTHSDMDDCQEFHEMALEACR